MREALFSTLQSLIEIGGRRFLDCYAGSGAVGLEARSRGAAHVLLVESAGPAVTVIRRNIEVLGLSDVEVDPRPVRTVLSEPPPSAYDVAFCDPPYNLAVSELAVALELVVRWLVPQGVLVVERATRDGAPPWPQAVQEQRSRRYGDTSLWYGRRS